MITFDFISMVISTADIQIQKGLTPGSLLIGFVLGCAAGCVVYWIQLKKNKKAQNPSDSTLDPLSCTNPLKTRTDSFPAARVKLEKRESGWFFTLISKGSDQMGPIWDSLQSMNEPNPLNRVFEDSETGVLTDVLDTAIKLNLPVNYECRLRTGLPEPYWVALLLSLDIEARKPVMHGIVISIMDRRILEQELYEEKLFAEQMLEFSGVVFSVRNKETKLIRTNKAFIEIGGYTPEEIYFSDGDQRLIGESYDFVMNQFKRVLRGEYPLVSENSWYCKDGTERTLRWTNTGLGDSEGQVNHIISVGVDITDLRLLESRLEEKIEEFRAMFENSLVGIALVKNDHIINANQICAELLGYSTAEIMGLNMKALFEDQAAYDKFSEEMVPRMTWGLRHFDYSFRKKGGKVGEFRISASPYKGGSSESGIIIVLDDVSEIKMVERALLRSETRFRTIFDKMASGLALITEDGYFDEVNDSWCRITGYSREEARRLRVLDITYEEDLTVSRETMDAFLADTLDIERMEKRYIRKDGSLLWVDLTASKIDARGDFGEITLVSIINDVTERKAIEEKLIEMNQSLEVEKNRVQVLADHRMAVIELFDTFRNSQSIEDIQAILKNNLSRFVKYRDLLVALRVSRSNPGYVVKDLLDETEDDDTLELIRSGKGVIGSVIRSRKIYLSNDVKKDPVFIPHHPEVRSYLAIPIIYKDFIWGVISLDHFEANHFTDQDVEILRMVGTLIAMQMEEMTAKLALHQESDRLRLLHDLVQEMAQARSNEDIIKKICSAELFSSVHIYTAGTAGELNPCRCLLCEEQGASIPVEAHSMDGRGQIFWESSGTSAFYNLALEISYNLESLGVLRVCNDVPFTYPEIELASILAEQTGVFWELNKLIMQREQEAMVDPLTAVWNRRYMIARLEQEDERIFRYGGTACVAIMDMGDFKLINDQYGHVKGDEVLFGAARLIEKNIRKTDYVGRYGGDEFIVFFPNTEHQEAERLVEKIGTGISHLLIEGINRKIEIDCGVAVVPGDDSSLLGAVRTADERMYLNKRERKRNSLSAR